MADRRVGGQQLPQGARPAGGQPQVPVSHPHEPLSTSPERSLGSVTAPLRHLYPASTGPMKAEEQVKRHLLPRSVSHVPPRTRVAG